MISLSIFILSMKGYLSNSDVYLPLQNEIWLQDLDAMEGAQLGLEAVVSAIFDGSFDSGKTDLETKSQLHKIFEGFTKPNLLYFGHTVLVQGANFLLLVNQAYFNSFFL